MSSDAIRGHCHFCGWAGGVYERDFPPDKRYGPPECRDLNCLVLQSQIILGRMELL